MTACTHLNENNIQFAGFVTILVNCVVRSLCPSQYVPYQRTCDHAIGSPYTARTIATFAELAFYYQVSMSLGLEELWYSYRSGVGLLLQLWLLGETLSWFGLVRQNATANASEDVVWFVWFVVAFVCSAHHARLMLVPVILAYVVWHFPRLFATTTTRRPEDTPDDKRVVAQLDESGQWVVPSVVAKLALYVVFVIISRWPSEPAA